MASPVSGLCPRGTAVPISFTRGTCSRPSFTTVTEAFYHYATTQPSATAARDLSAEPPVEISYGELAQRSIRLAQRLRSLGVMPGHRVPLVVKRGVGMLVGIISILSCGAQYIPLDGGVVAEETLRFVVEQTGRRVVSASPSTTHRLSNMDIAHVVTIDDISEIESSQESVGDFTPFSNPDDGCYVIYTSGSWIYISTTICIKLTATRHNWYTKRSGRHPPQCHKPRLPSTRQLGYRPGNLCWSVIERQFRYG
jgi:non-ribosomal peptide synthetase component F